MPTRAAELLQEEEEGREYVARTRNKLMLLVLLLVESPQMSQVDCHCHIESDEQQQPKLVCFVFALASQLQFPMCGSHKQLLASLLHSLLFLPPASVFSGFHYLSSSPFCLLSSLLFFTRSLLKLLSFSFPCGSPLLLHPLCYLPRSLPSSLFPLLSSFHCLLCLSLACFLSLCLSCFALLCVALASVSSFCLPHTHTRAP